MIRLFGGSMLTGSEIERQVKKGNIEIDPFDTERINPNSYNLSLNKDLCVYKRGINKDGIIPQIHDITNTKECNNDPVVMNHIEYPECKLLQLNNNDFLLETVIDAGTKYEMPIEPFENNKVISFTIPETGIVLQPNVLYIGSTNERIATNKFIPMIDGRSSGGRLGLSIHICAGFGDIGFDGTFTLEISVVEPLIIYPNMQIAQVCFYTPYGKTDRMYSGKYQNQEVATPSRLWYEVH